MSSLAAFAVAAPGLAPLVADELRGLGITPSDVDEAGVAFDATAEQLWRANLWLRTASRVLVRGRKGIAAPTRLMPGLVLHEPDGRYTAAADAVLRHGAGIVL